MLKRSDLVKQFELVVQQEIKNHNDQMLATNLAINEIHQKVEYHKLMQDKANNAFSSSISNINITISTISEIFSEITQKIDSHINDQKVLNERNASKYQEMVEAIERLFKLDEKLSFSLNRQGTWIHENNEEVRNLSRAITLNLEELDRKYSANLQKMKLEILSLPSEAKAVKKELEDKMAIDKVDFEGLLKELRVYKRENLIQQKEIEKLQILIDRLEKRIKP